MEIIANGVRLHYTEAGAGPAVICLHGLGLNLGLFRHQFPLWSQRYRTIAYDLRGMGQSEAPGRRGGTHTVEMHAHDLGALLDALQVQGASLVAQAFGAFAALHYAVQHPERVRALIVFNTCAFMGEPGISQGLYRAARAELDGMDPLLDTAMTRWFTEPFRREHPEAIQYYRKMLGSTPPLGYAASARELAQLDLRPELAQVKCPTLVLAGELDWSTPVAAHEVIAASIPNSRLVVVQGASHTLPEEQPEEFARLSLAFLEESLRRPAS
jgi:3-oxoadipate enol-lactonase